MGTIMKMNNKKNSLAITIAVAAVAALSSIPIIRRIWNKMSFINPEMFE
jgi:hypothetical protein